MPRGRLGYPVALFLYCMMLCFSAHISSIPSLFGELLNFILALMTGIVDITTVSDQEMRNAGFFRPCTFENSILSVIIKRRFTEMKKLIPVTVTFMIAAQTVWGQTGIAGRSGVTLENTSAIVVYDLGGGSLADFHLKVGGPNPFTWNHPEPGDRTPRSMGHFICYDRWGPASEAEIENGVPWHGEATSVMWHLDSAPRQGEGGIEAAMSCELPIAGMTMQRTITLDPREPVMVVRERFTNENKLGRLYNVVQHATVGPPFLDEAMLIDTEVEKGFSQKGDVPVPEEPVLYWPKAVHNDELVDFRTLSGDNRGPGVVSFVLGESAEYGWVTTCSPANGLLVGYVWSRSDYPWLSMWRSVQRDEPAAFGMEFGSTGLHQPFGVQVRKGTVWGRRLYEYIDAGETQQKSFTVFLANIPADFQGVASILVERGRIVLTEHGDNPRTVTVSASVLP